MELSEISLVIPYRKSPYLEKVLESVYKYFSEIIVVGDKFNQKEKYQNINFKEFVNLNASQARNIGAKYATKKYIFFLDSDCIPSISFLNSIKELIISRNEILASTYTTDKDQNNFISDVMSLLIKTRLLNQNSKHKKFSSAGFIISKEFFNYIGRFNEDMNSLEDTDLSVRANIYGCKVKYDKNFELLHLKKYNLIKLISECIYKSFDGSKYLTLNKDFFNTIGINVPIKNFISLFPLISIFFIPISFTLAIFFFILTYSINIFLFRNIFQNYLQKIFGPSIALIKYLSFIFGGTAGKIYVYVSIYIPNLLRDFFDYLISIKRVIIKSKYPVQIIQYVTARCNLRCNHCFYKETLNAKDPGEMEIDEIIRPAKKMAPMLWYSITGGEVFIRNDFKKLVLEIQKHIRPKFFSLPTNGWYTERTFQSVLETLQSLKRGNLILFFSIDGPEKIHDDIRGNNSYTKLKITYEKLKKLTKYYPKLHLNIVITVQPNNHHVFPNFLHEIQNEFNPISISINLLRYHSLNSPKLDPEIINAYELAINEYEKNIRTKNKYNFVMNSIIKAKEKNQKDIIVDVAKKDKFTTPCSAGNLSYVIMENGNLKPCEVLETSYGNIKEENVLDIINNNKAVKNRKWIKNTKCRCTYECANSTNALFNYNMLPSLFKTMVKDMLR